MSSWKYDEQTYNSQTSRGSDYTSDGPAKYGEQATRLKLVRLDKAFMANTVERKKEDIKKVPRVQPVDNPDCFSLHKGDHLFCVPGETNTEHHCIGTMNGVKVEVEDGNWYNIRRAMEDKIELVGGITIEVNGKDVKEGHSQVEKSVWRGGGHDSTINNGCFHIKEGELLMRLPPIINAKGELEAPPSEHSMEWGDPEYVGKESYGGYYAHPGIRRPLILVPVREALIPRMSIEDFDLDKLKTTLEATKMEDFDAELQKLSKNDLRNKLLLAQFGVKLVEDLAPLGSAAEPKDKRQDRLKTIQSLTLKRLNDSKYPKQHARSHLIYAVAESSARPGEQFSIYILEGRL